MCTQKPRPASVHFHMCTSDEFENGASEQVKEKEECERKRRKKKGKESEMRRREHRGAETDLEEKRGKAGRDV